MEGYGLWWLLPHDGNKILGGHILIEEVIDIFRKTGSIREGHFLLASGLHSPVYFDKMRVLSNPEASFPLFEKLSDKLKEINIEVVIGPALGGVIIAFEVAKRLGLKCAFADRIGDKRVIRPKETLEKGMKVGVVDDILTTGKSIRETLLALEEHNVETCVIGIILDRSGGEVDLGIPLVSLASLKIESYKPEECPLCQKGIPLEILGSATRKA